MIKKVWQFIMGEDYNYVSPDEIFLQQFDVQHKQNTLSQKCEISKHQKIAQSRDHVLESNKRTISWE